MGNFLGSPEIERPGSARDLRSSSLNAGGLRGRSRDGRTRVGSSPQRRRLVGSIASTFPEQAGLVRDLRLSVAPGFSDLRASRLREIENARRRSIGNLRDNLARRRVLGSSFGEDALVRGELTFAEEADRVAAETFLQELDLTNQLINQEFNLRRQQFTTRLDELNLQADLGLKLSGQATTALTNLAAIESQLAIQQAQFDAEAAQGAGDLFSLAGGTIGTAVGGPVGGVIGSTLGGLAGSAVS